MNAWEDKEGLYLLKRLKIEGYLSKYPTQSKKLSDFENAEIWIKEVTATTVNFFKERPHLKFIDVCIEDIQTPKLLANFFKIPKINLEHDNTGHYDGHKTAAPTPNFANAADEKWLNTISPPSYKPTPTFYDAENWINSLKYNRLKH
jgi:hypothetical protein